MIAYLIHCSLVWLIALLVYEVWLRRTTFHSANRWYLNVSLLLGLLLPLYQPAMTHPDVVPVLEQPMHQLALRQQRIEVIGQTAGNAFHLTSILFVVAIAGASVRLLELLRESVALFRRRRQSVRQELFGIPFYVTGTQHGPFSAFGAIYLNGTDAYSEDELRFILTHEQAHLQYRHSMDKSFMLLLRALLWWHPLVYLFYSRLSLVQEFQADQPLKQQAPAYGRFLIDESLAVDGVGITHQFYHSPLKTRIRMLQRFATRNWQKAGYVAALALLAGGSFLWTNKSLAHKEEKNGNIITFNGNKFETGVPEFTTVSGQKISGNVQLEIAKTVPAKGHTATVTDSAGRSTVVAKNARIVGKPMMVRLAEIPLKMNGAPIFRASELDRQASLTDGRNIEMAIIDSYMPSLSRLPNGRYGLDLSMIIADAEGKIVYYQARDVEWLVVIRPGADGMSVEDQIAQSKKEKEAHAIPGKLQAQLRTELEAALESIRLSPAEKNGKPVIGYVEARNAKTSYVAEISNGRIKAVNWVGH